MTKNELLIRLKDMDLSLIDFSEITGVSPGTVYNWVDCPKWVVHLLDGIEAKCRIDESDESLADLRAGLSGVMARMNDLIAHE